MFVAWALRDTTTAVSRAEEFLALGREIDRPQTVGFAKAVLAVNLAIAGELSRARVLAEGALSEYGPGMAASTAWPHYVLTRIHAAR